MGHQATQVRDDIVNRVLARELNPGDRIDEVDLKERLSLSGTPIREALIHLEAEGIVERRPRGGALIVSLDLEGLIKMTEALAELEGSVAALASRRINRTQASRLETCVKDCLDHANGSREFQASYFDLNVAFHVSMAEAAGNEHMAKSLFNVGNRLVAYLATRHDLPGEPLRSARDHQAIFGAVLDADGPKARDLMIAHTVFSDGMALDVTNALRRCG